MVEMILVDQDGYRHNVAMLNNTVSYHSDKRKFPFLQQILQNKSLDLTKCGAFMMHYVISSIVDMFMET